MGEKRGSIFRVSRFLLFNYFFSLAYCFLDYFDFEFSFDLIFYSTALLSC